MKSWSLIGAEMAFFLVVLRLVVLLCLDTALVLIDLVRTDNLRGLDV